MKLFFVIYIFSITCVFSQNYSIKGKVQDSNKSPLELIEINLLKSDSIYYSEITNNQGDFFFKNIKGEFDLEIVNFNIPVLTKRILVDRDLDLGTINIENTINLKETTINARKKLIENKIDRLIFNVENSASAIGGDVLDAIKLIPEVKILNDRLSIVGKGSVLLMIDNKLINLSGEELINFLRTIKSDDVKNIELINNPSSKYDAEGNVGLINLNLKKNIVNTWSNNFKFSYQQGKHPSFSFGNNFNYKKDKFSLFFDFSINKNNTIYKNDINYFYPDENWKNEIFKKTKSTNFVSLLNISYDASKKLNFGVQYLGSGGSSDQNETGLSNIFYKNISISNKNLQSEGYTHKKTYNHYFNFSVLNKLDTLGKQFSIDTDYFTFYSNKNNNINADEINNVFTVNKTKIENNNLQKIENFSSKIDFELPFKWFTTSFGGKLSFGYTNLVGSKS